MILLTVNSKVETIIGQSYVEELNIFNEKWEWLKGKFGQTPRSNIQYKKLDTSFFVRTIDSEGVEGLISGHIVDHPALMNKKWQFEDRVVENSQGGTTHLNGWYLS